MDDELKSKEIFKSLRNGRPSLTAPEPDESSASLPADFWWGCDDDGMPRLVGVGGPLNPDYPFTSRFP